MTDQKNHPYPFDPRFGFTQKELTEIQSPDETPADFCAFWQSAYQEAQTIPLEFQSKELPCETEGQKLFEISYRVWPDYRVGAWMYLPENTQALKLGIVVGHGYGGRQEVDPGLCGKDRAVIFPVAPGFDLSQDPRLPKNDASLHVVHGIESKETYILRSCVAALWRAIDVLIEVSRGQLGDFHYTGGSFGGGLGGLMLPWEKRYRSAELRQVTFANQYFRLRHESGGSAKAVRERWLKDPAIEEVLHYYDAAIHLRKLETPVIFECALFDPNVPPPGQWSAANAHPGPKRIFVAPTGHFNYEKEAAYRSGSEYKNLRNEFFGSRLT
ncbi:acetylxylan esterase [Kiritimatiellaeota bacterium B1221]|nr:acetylxylan esterase [Kiritimatiellaeota bacterium B1221]